MMQTIKILKTFKTFGIFKIGEALTNDRGRLLMNSKLALPPQMEVLTEAAEMAVGAKARHSAARVVEVPRVVQKP